MKNRVLILLVAFFILVCLGVVYSFSLFVSPIEMDLEINRAESSIAFTLSFICFSIGNLVAGILNKHTNVKIILKICALMVCTGFFVTTMIHTAFELYITYSVLCGISCGVVYNTIVSYVPLLFVNKSGLTSGFLLTGFSLSTTLLSPVIESGLTLFGWKKVFIAIALICGIVVFIGSLLISNRTNDKILKKDISLSMLKDVRFYLFIVIYICNGGVGMAIINHALPILEEDFMIKTMVAVTIISIITVFNGIGRTIWGIGFDKYSMNKILVFLGFISFLSTVMIFFSERWDCLALLISGCSIVLFAYGGSSALCPMVVRKLFGNDDFSFNFALTSLGGFLISLFPTVIGVIRASSYNYQSSFLLFVCMGCITLGTALLFSQVNNE